ncbi:exosortase A [Arhodomonas sp. SL1]|uniref:exosortase A n=1 Tax=Arhodomonas sp. SL1 TaxID=3425691 RepID=UPI003F884784
MSATAREFPGAEGAGGGGALSPLQAAAVTTALLALVSVLYAEVFAEMAVTWWRSETYAHGWLVAPIAAWLMWRKREAVLAVPPAPSPWALAMLATMGFSWLLGEIAGVTVVRQYAVMAMVPGLVWLVFGTRVLRLLAFPLAFLLLAVPVGEFLIPPMMSFTAEFTIALLRLTGLPVYREGLFFYLPSGSWEVAEACSGIRYLIASFTLGCLYAYLAYRQLWRRLSFVAASLALPVLANGLRAYGIVLIGHFSGMRYAVGFDHLIYGWVFFGLVMALLFWVGRLWRESPQYSAASTTAQVAEGPRMGWATVVGAGAFTLLVWPMWALALVDGPVVASVSRWQPPVSLAGWQRETGPPLWQPGVTGATELFAQAMTGPRRRGGVAAAVFAGQYEGAELIAWENRVRGGGDWREIGRGTVDLGVGDQRLEAVKLRLRGRQEDLVVIYWYRVAGVNTTSRLTAKALAAWQRLWDRPDIGVLFAAFEAVPADVSARGVEPLALALNAALPDAAQESE